MRLFGRDTEDLRESVREHIELPLRNTFAPAQEPRENGHANMAEGGKNPAQDPKYKAAQNRRKYIIAGLVFLSFFLFSGLAYKRKAVSSLWPGSKLPVQDHNLYLLIPSMGEETDVNTCRTLLSASVLTYPTPWVVDYSASQSKASRIVNFLEKYTQSDDMIVVLEDTWFQLRSEVLVQRYFDILHSQTKKSDVSGPNLLASGQGDAMEKGLFMGSSKHMQEAYRHASNNGLELDQIYSTQQAKRASKLFRRQSESEQDGPADAPAFKIGLDEEHRLLAPLSSLHKASPSESTDLATSAPPFWTISGYTTTGMPNSSWSQIELLSTDDSQHTAPAALHYSTDAGSSALQESWFSLWYHEHARDLLTFSSKRPEVPLAIVLDQTQESTIERRFWNSLLPYTGPSKVGVKKTSDEKFHTWASICGATRESNGIFGDDKGRWEETK